MHASPLYSKASSKPVLGKPTSAEAQPNQLNQLGAAARHNTRRAPAPLVLEPQPQPQLQQMALSALMGQISPVKYMASAPAVFASAAAAPAFSPTPPPVALDGLRSEYLIEAEHIVLGRELGEGFFGVVHSGAWQGQPVAVKRLKQHVRRGELENFRAEVDVLGRLRHPNITTFYGVTQPPNAMIVTELLTGSLNHLIYSPESARLSMKVLIRIAQDVAAGVAYLHGRSPPLIHRDLSSANVLITGSVDELERDVDDFRRPLAKVSDFGLSRTVDWYMTSCVGNLYYLAPEVFKGEHYSEKVDVYSFAIMLVELFGREPPMKGMVPQKAAFQCAVMNYRPPLPSATPEHLRPLIRSCWSADPEDRPSFVEVISRLRNEPGLTSEPPLSPSRVLHKAASKEQDSGRLQWLHVAEMLMEHLIRRPPLWQLVDRGIVEVDNAEYWILGRRGPVPIAAPADSPRLYHQYSHEAKANGSDKAPTKPQAEAPPAVYDEIPLSAFVSAQGSTAAQPTSDTMDLQSILQTDHSVRPRRGLSDCSLKDTFLEEQTLQEMSGKSKGEVPPEVVVTTKFQSVLGV